MSLLELVGVSKLYARQALLFGQSKKTIKAVDNVSLTINSGASLSVVGESGCGKSTLARLILGLEKPEQGQVYFRGWNIWQLPKDAIKIYRREVQLVFQDTLSSFNPRMRIKNIMAEPLENYYPGEQKSYFKKTQVLLELVGLHQACLECYPHQLSGGQRQRLGIARALVSQPKLLVCDEVIANLDASLQGQILVLFQHLKQQLGLSIIFISHHLPAAQYLADTIVVLRAGRIVEVLPKEKMSSGAKHPYTLALLASLPANHPRERKNSELC